MYSFRKIKKIIIKICIPMIPIIIFILMFQFSLASYRQVSTMPTYVNNINNINNAAIIDQLSLTFPNENFIQESRKILEESGYKVDYYPGENVTTKFYKNLPRYRYEIIIFRSHSVLGVKEKYLNLFTSEPYDKNKYVYEQLAGYVTQISQSERGENLKFYFGITPRFIRDINGEFNDTVIIMMGCNGLTTYDMAQAFIDKKAKVYIGWNDNITAHHSDKATLNLLRYLLTEKLTLEKSMVKGYKEIGKDLMYDSILSYYPTEMGNQTIIKEVDNKNTTIQMRRT